MKEDVTEAQTQVQKGSGVWGGWEGTFWGGVLRALKKRTARASEVSKP